MIHDFLLWVGWYSGELMPPAAAAFWSTPLGLACSFIMMVYSTCRVLHPHYKADNLDTLFNGLFALLFLIAFSAGLDNDVPHYIVKTWLLLATLRCILRGSVDWYTGNKKAR